MSIMKTDIDTVTSTVAVKPKSANTNSQIQQQEAVLFS